MKVDNILIPIDFSENADRVLTDGIFVAEKFGAKIHVVFAAQIFQDYSEFFVMHVPNIQYEENIVASAEKRMEAFLEKSQGEDFKCTHKILSGDVAESILEYVEEEGIDMIVMGTHGYKGLDKILFGSVAEKVVKMAKCPVLTINPYR